MTDAEDTTSRTIESLVAQIAGLLQHGGGMLTTGDVAALRRMDPAKPAAAFFKLTGVVLDGALGSGAHREQVETKWASIIVGLAHLGALHRPHEQLGQALVRADYSELRFSRLLRADAARLVDELPGLARFLTAKGVDVDWSDAARLMLSTGGPKEESVRRRLARDYYRALAGTVTT